MSDYISAVEIFTPTIIDIAAQDDRTIVPLEFTASGLNAIVSRFMNGKGVGTSQIICSYINIRVLKSPVDTPRTAA